MAAENSDALRRFPKSLFVFVVAAGLAACQHGQTGVATSKTQLAESGGPGSSDAAESSKAETKAQPQAAPGAILTGSIPSIKGPKRTVAVGKVDAIGAFTAHYGEWDIGGGLAAMLVSALKESDQFIVMERANISQLLAEQEMAASGVTKPGTGPELGKLAGIQFLIYGAVTEFGAEDEGGGISLGVSGGGIGNLLSGALSQQSASGSVAMDVRVVDTSTGEIVETYQVKEPISSSGFDISAGYQGISLGTNEFYKTPLGEASRRMVTKAVRLVAETAAQTAWTGRIVDFDGRDAYINAGVSSGIQAGDRFMVERVVKRFTDPTTGELLGVRKHEIGVVQVTGVEEKLAYGPFLPLGTKPPRRGDLVVVME